MNYKKIVAVVLGLSSSVVFSGTMGESRSSFYLLAGSGASFANPANLSFDANMWSGSPDGYNSTLGDSPLYTAGVGYVWNDAINMDVSYAYRGLYSYDKFQLPAPTASADPNPLTVSRTRYFDLSSNALLFNITILGQGLKNQLVYTTTTGLVQPFIGGGLGVSYNTVSNFHTILADTNYSTSVMADNTQASLAYQFNAGLEWSYKRVAVDLGYRYFNGGTYSSNNYLTTNLNTAGTPVSTTQISPWTGTLSANEVFVTAKMYF